MNDKLRLIPSVELIIQTDQFVEIFKNHPRALVLSVLNVEIEQLRNRMLKGEFHDKAVEIIPLADSVKKELLICEKPSLNRVLNGTGVILHTNLGRAILAKNALAAMGMISSGYSNLEYDISNGMRGSRYDHCSLLLKELTGAQSALLLNNGASALVMALRSMAFGKEVLVSRGELVEIGGGFRIPEILECSGARLVEVGTTNRTRIEDYRKAAGSGKAGMILKIHRSNFNITGFTEEASLSSLVDLGRELGLPVVHDLGSGLLIDPGSLGLPPEPTPKESLSQGTDIVIFSGDKLLGGPQAGILVGSGEEWITGMRKDPLCRALRVDKMTLAALEATLSLYRDPKVAMAEVPILRMLSASVGELTERASMLVAALAGASINVEIIDCCSVMGGGTFPGFELPSIGLSVEIHGCSPDRLATKLRSFEVPTVGRVEKDLLLIDLRTISQDQDQQLIENLSSLCS